MKTKILLLLAVYLCGTAQSAAPYSKVHEKLNDDEYQKIFHRTRRDVPDYEFVNINSKSDHRSKRELRPVEFDVDKKKVHLNLHPAQHNVYSNYIPVWFAETHAGRNYVYRPANPQQTKIDGIFYEDVKNMATLLAYYKNQYIYYDGIFGESKTSKVVRSAPEKWWRSPGADENENHFVYGTQQSGNSESLLSNGGNHNDQKLARPLETLYPKLLVIVDYSHFEKLRKDVEETVKYVATFWNAVNLKYSKLNSPKVKITLTGLIIARDPTALDYVYRAQNQTDLTKLNPYKMLDLGRAYFRDEFGKALHFDNYDSTFTLTNLDTGINAGAAYESEICDEHYNIGYCRDDGSFSGLLAATHELGHLLSLPHDAKNLSGCEDISDDRSTVMAPFVSEVKEFVWSECSKKLLRRFSWNKKAACLENDRRERHFKRY